MEGDYLLTESIIKVDSVKVSKEEVTNELLQLPNNRFLGIPLQLNIYNLAKPNPQKSYDEWLNRNKNTQKFLTQLLSAKQVDRLGDSFLVSGVSNILKDFGESPVIFDTNKTEKSAIRLKNHYFNQGYFNTKVSTRIDTVSKNKKAKVQYYVTLGKQYAIDSISYITNTKPIDELIIKAKENSLLKKGNTYNLNILDQERDRLTTYLRNNGVYDFQKTNISFDIDTLSKQTNVAVILEDKTIKSGDSLIKEPFKIYKVNQIRINLNDPKNNKLTEYKNLQIFSDNDIKYDLNLLANSVFIESNAPYSDAQRSLTTQAFSNLGVFNYPTINYTVDKNDTISNGLIANINLNSRKRASFNPTIDFTHSNIQQVGIEGSVGTSFRNVFGGAEILDIGIKGNIGSSASRYRNNQNTFFDILEYGADIKLKFPKLLFFFNTDKIIPRHMFPSTTLSLGFSNQQNIGLDKQNLSSVLNYNWKRTKNTQLSLDLFNLQFVRNMNPDNYFNVYRSSYNNLNRIALDNEVPISYLDQTGNLSIAEGGADAFISDVLNNFTDLKPSDQDYRTVSSISERKRRLTENNLILSTNLTYTKTTRSNIKDNNFYIFKTKLESAGNLINLIANNNVNDNDKKTIFDVAYSQYIKTEIDYIKYFDLGKKNVLALRLFGGIAIPYGNSDNIPFSKSYFAGGTNDNRAWQSYRLGPGKSEGFYDFNEANMKLAFSTEYRFNISGAWNMALFVDAGNIWNALDNTEDNNMTFNGLSSLKDIAIGSGFGIRYDFNFFVVRSDFGFKTYNPSKPTENQWFKEWNFSKMVLNIGINYPF